MSVEDERGHHEDNIKQGDRTRDSWPDGPKSRRVVKSGDGIPLSIAIYGTELYAGSVEMDRSVQELITGLGKQTDLKIGLRIDSGEDGKVLRMVLVPEQAVAKVPTRKLAHKTIKVDCHCAECGCHMLTAYKWMKNGVEMVTCIDCMWEAPQ